MVLLKYQLTATALLRITTNHWPADVQILIVFVYTFESQWALDAGLVGCMIDILLKFIEI